MSNKQQRQRKWRQMNREKNCCVLWHVFQNIFIVVWEYRHAREFPYHFMKLLFLLSIHSICHILITHYKANEMTPTKWYVFYLNSSWHSRRFCFPLVSLDFLCSRDTSLFFILLTSHSYRPESRMSINRIYVSTRTGIHLCCGSRCARILYYVTNLAISFFGWCVFIANAICTIDSNGVMYAALGNNWSTHSAYSGAMLNGCSEKPTHNKNQARNDFV